MAVLSTFAYGSGLSWFDPSTGAVKHVSAYYYRAGTLDPITVYTTSDLSIPFPLPVLTTGYGKMPPIWVGPQAVPGYRVRVFDQFSTLVEDVDNIPGPVDTTGSGGGGGTINPGDPRLYATGDLIFAMSNAQPRAGAVLCNGLAIGSINSTYATLRANNDTQALFLYLWGQDQFGLLPVLPSRGSTAQGDWDANKAISVPDLMGRVLVGMDAMATTARNRLAGVTFAAGDQAKIGSYGGAVSYTLTAANIPAHTHALTDPGHYHYSVVPAHTHGASGSSDSQGSHTHTGSTDTEAAHTHTYNAPTSQSNYGGGPGSAGAPTGTSTATGAAGAHSHALSINAAGLHSHNIGVTVASNGPWGVNSDAKTTGITMASYGSGAAYTTMVPFYTVAVYIKL